MNTDASRLSIAAEAFQLAPPAPSTLAAVLISTTGISPGESKKTQEEASACLIHGCRATLNPLEWPCIRDTVVAACKTTEHQDGRRQQLGRSLNVGVNKRILDARDSLRVEAAQALCERDGPSDKGGAQIRREDRTGGFRHEQQLELIPDEIGAGPKWFKHLSTMYRLSATQNRTSIGAEDGEKPETETRSSSAKAGGLKQLDIPGEAKTGAASRSDGADSSPRKGKHQSARSVRSLAETTSKSATEKKELPPPPAGKPVNILKAVRALVQTESRRKASPSELAAREVGQLPLLRLPRVLACSEPGMEAFRLEAPGDVRRHLDSNQARLPDTNERRGSAQLDTLPVGLGGASGTGSLADRGTTSPSVASSGSGRHARHRSRAFDRPKDIDHLLPSDWDAVTRAVAHAGSSRFQRVRLDSVPTKLRALLQAGRIKFRLREPIVFYKDPSTLQIHLIADDEQLEKAKTRAAAFFISLGHVHRRLNACLRVLRQHQPKLLPRAVHTSSQVSVSKRTDNTEENYSKREEEVLKDQQARRAALREVHAMVWLPPMRKRLVAEALPVILANAAAYCEDGRSAAQILRSWPRLHEDIHFDASAGLHTTAGGRHRRRQSSDISREEFSMAARCIRVIAALAMATAGRHGYDSAHPGKQPVPESKGATVGTSQAESDRERQGCLVQHWGLSTVCAAHSILEHVATLGIGMQQKLYSAEAVGDATTPDEQHDSDSIDSDDVAMSSKRSSAKREVSLVGNSMRSRASSRDGEPQVAPVGLTSHSAPHPRHICDVIECSVVLIRVLCCSKPGLRVVLFGVGGEPTARTALQHSVLSHAIRCLHWSHNGFVRLAAGLDRLPTHPRDNATWEPIDKEQRAAASNWQLDPGSDSDEVEQERPPFDGLQSVNSWVPPASRLADPSMGSVLERRSTRRQLRSLESARCTRELCTQVLGAVASHDAGQVNRIVTAVGGAGWRVCGPLSASVFDRTATESAGMAAFLSSVGLASSGGILSKKLEVSGGGVAVDRLFSWQQAMQTAVYPQGVPSLDEALHKHELTSTAYYFEHEKEMQAAMQTSSTRAARLARPSKNILVPRSMRDSSEFLRCIDASRAWFRSGMSVNTLGGLWPAREPVHWIQGGSRTRQQEQRRIGQQLQDVCRLTHKKICEIKRSELVQRQVYHSSTLGIEAVTTVDRSGPSGQHVHSAGAQASEVEVEGMLPLVCHSILGPSQSPMSLFSGALGASAAWAEVSAAARALERFRVARETDDNMPLRRLLQAFWFKSTDISQLMVSSSLMDDELGRRLRWPMRPDLGRVFVRRRGLDIHLAEADLRTGWNDALEGLVHSTGHAQAVDRAFIPIGAAGIVRPHLLQQQQLSSTGMLTKTIWFGIVAGHAHLDPEDDAVSSNGKPSVAPVSLLSLERIQLRRCMLGAVSAAPALVLRDALRAVSLRKGEEYSAEKDTLTVQLVNFALNSTERNTEERLFRDASVSACALRQLLHQTIAPRRLGDIASHLSGLVRKMLSLCRQLRLGLFQAGQAQRAKRESMQAASRLRSAQSTLRRASQELLSSKTSEDQKAGFTPSAKTSARASQAEVRSSVAQDQAETAAKAMQRARGRLLDSMKRGRRSPTERSVPIRELSRHLNGASEVAIILLQCLRRLLDISFKVQDYPSAALAVVEATVAVLPETCSSSELGIVMHGLDLHWRSSRLLHAFEGIGPAPSEPCVQGLVVSCGAAAAVGIIAREVFLPSGTRTDAKRTTGVGSSSIGGGSIDQKASLHGEPTSSSGDSGSVDKASACKMLIAADSSGGRVTREVLPPLQAALVSTHAPEDNALATIVSLLRQLRRVLVREMDCFGSANVMPWITRTATGSAQVALPRTTCSPIDPTIGDQTRLSGVQDTSLDGSDPLRDQKRVLNELLHAPQSSSRGIPIVVPTGSNMPWLGVANPRIGAIGILETMREAIGAVWAGLQLTSTKDKVASISVVASAVSALLSPVSFNCAGAIQLIRTAPDSVDIQANTSRRAGIGPKFAFHDSETFSFPSSGLSADKPAAAFDRFRKQHFSHVGASGAEGDISNSQDQGTRDPRWRQYDETHGFSEVARSIAELGKAREVIVASGKQRIRDRLCRGVVQQSSQAVGLLLNRIEGNDAVDRAIRALSQTPAITSEKMALDGMEPTAFMSRVSAQLVHWFQDLQGLGSTDKAQTSASIAPSGTPSRRQEAPLSCQDALRMQTLREQSVHGAAVESVAPDFVELRESSSHFRNTLLGCTIEAAASLAVSLPATAEGLAKIYQSGLPAGLLLSASVTSTPSSLRARSLEILCQCHTIWRQTTSRSFRAISQGSRVRDKGFGQGAAIPRISAASDTLPTVMHSVQLILGESCMWRSCTHMLRCIGNPPGDLQLNSTKTVVSPGEHGMLRRGPSSADSALFVAAVAPPQSGPQSSGKGDRPIGDDMKNFIRKIVRKAWDTQLVVQESIASLLASLSAEIGHGSGDSGCCGRIVAVVRRIRKCIRQVSVEVEDVESSRQYSSMVRQLHKTLALLLVALVNLSAEDKFRSPQKRGIMCIFGMAYPCSRFKPLEGGGTVHLKPNVPAAIQSLAMKLVTNLSHSPGHRSLLYRSELAHRARTVRCSKKQTWAVDEPSWRIKYATFKATTFDPSSTDSEADDPLIDTATDFESLGGETMASRHAIKTTATARVRTQTRSTTLSSGKGLQQVLQRPALDRRVIVRREEMASAASGSIQVGSAEEVKTRPRTARLLRSSPVAPPSQSGGRSFGRSRRGVLARAKEERGQVTPQRPESARPLRGSRRPGSGRRTIRQPKLVPTPQYLSRGDSHQPSTVKSQLQRQPSEVMDAQNAAVSEFQAKLRWAPDVRSVAAAGRSSTVHRIAQAAIETKGGQGEFSTPGIVQDGKILVRAGESEQVDFEGTFIAYGRVLKAAPLAEHQRVPDSGFRTPSKVTQHRFGFESPNLGAREHLGLLRDPDDPDEDSPRGPNESEHSRTVSRAQNTSLIHQIRLSREVAGSPRRDVVGSPAAATQDVIGATHSAVERATSSFGPRGMSADHGLERSPMRFSAHFEHDSERSKVESTPFLSLDELPSSRQPAARAGPGSAPRTLLGRVAPPRDSLTPFLRRQARNSTRSDALIADALGLEVSYDPRSSSDVAQRLVAPSVEDVVGPHEVAEHVVDGSGHVRYYPKSQTAPKLQFEATVQHDRLVRFKFGETANDVLPATLSKKAAREEAGNPASASPKLWAFEAHEGSRIAEEAGIPSQQLPNGRIVRYYFKSDVHRALYSHQFHSSRFPSDPLEDLRRLSDAVPAMNVSMVEEDCPLLRMHRLDERRLPPIGSFLDPTSLRWRSRPWARGAVFPSPFEGRLQLYFDDRTYTIPQLPALPRERRATDLKARTKQAVEKVVSVFKPRSRESPSSTLFTGEAVSARAIRIEWKRQELKGALHVMVNRLYKELRGGPRGSGDLDRTLNVLCEPTNAELILAVFDLYAAVTGGTDTDAFLTLTQAGFHLFAAHSGIVQVPGMTTGNDTRRISKHALRGSDIDTIYIQAQVQTKRLQEARATKATRGHSPSPRSSSGAGGFRGGTHSGATQRGRSVTKGAAAASSGSKARRSPSPTKVMLPPEPADRSLHRWQFIESLVRIAHDMYIRSSKEPSLAGAVRRLLDQDLKRRLPFFVQIAGDRYRRRRLYTLAVDDAIRPHLPTLRRLHSTYASPSATFSVEVPVKRGKALLKAVAGALRMRLALMGSAGLKGRNGDGGGTSATRGLLGGVGRVAAAQQDAITAPASGAGEDSSRSSKPSTRTVRLPLMALEGFMRLMNDAYLVDGDLTKRDAVLAFTFARLRHADPLRSSADMQRNTHLSFMDFLEAICRVADSHSLPTREQMQSVGAENPHEFFKKLDSAGQPRPRRPSGAWMAPKSRPLGVKVQLLLDRMMAGLKDRVAVLKEHDADIRSALVPTPAGGLAIPAAALASIKDPKKAVEFVRAATQLASRAARARAVVASNSKGAGDGRSKSPGQMFVVEGSGIGGIGKSAVHSSGPRIVLEGTSGAEARRRGSVVIGAGDLARLAGAVQGADLSSKASVRRRIGGRRQSV